MVAVPNRDPLKSRLQFTTFSKCASQATAPCNHKAERMSLFENSEYQWRETFFIFFEDARRPEADKVKKALEQLGRLEVSNVRADDDGRIDSITIVSPDDFAAMDVSCVAGEEVLEQLPEIISELEPNLDTDEEKSKFKQLPNCTARMDVFHFQRNSGTVSDEESPDEFMDPGGLLVVLERLGELCHGVVVDPQAGGLM